MPQADLSLDTLTIEAADSDSLKSLEVKEGKARVGAYAIRFSGADQKDLTGEYFTKSTDYGPRNGDGVVSMFNHGSLIADGLDYLATKTFAPVKALKDDIGIFVETVLNLSDEYEAAIAQLVADGKLKWSSGTSNHLARKAADGQILRWHPIEFSYTPTPAESRLPAITPLKSVTVGPEEAAAIAKAFPKTVDKPTSTKIDEPKISLPTPEPKITMTEAEQKAAQEKAIKDATALRNKEINEIFAIADKFGARDEARKFVEEGKSLDEFKTFILVEKLKAVPVVTDPNIGLSKKEVKRWSLVKAIRDIAQTGRVQGFEKECSDATAKAIGRSADGFFIPHDVATMSLAEANDLGDSTVKALNEAVKAMTKALNVTTFTAGGAFVQTDILGAELVELLRNKMFVLALGARQLNGLVGNVAVPKHTGASSAFWLSESAATTEADQTVSQIGLTPHRLGAFTAYQKELLMQSSIDVEGFVRDDLMRVLAIAADLAAINGSGAAGQPTGIVNWTGIGSVTFGAAADWPHILSFETQVANANALLGSLSYLTTPNTRAKLKAAAKIGSTFPIFIWEDGAANSAGGSGKVNGYRAEATLQVPSDKVIYGNWSDLLWANWAGTDVVVNPYTNDVNAQIRVVIHQWMDFAVRHAGSFAVSTDSGAQ